MRTRGALAGLGVLGTAVVIGTGFLTLRPEHGRPSQQIAAQRHKTARLERTVERELQKNINQELAAKGTAIRIVRVACSRKGLGASYFCYAGALSPYGARACYGVNVRYLPAKRWMAYQGSRLPRCPGDQGQALGS